MTYAVTDTATVLVDHEALSFMLQACSTPGARVGLIGFNEYSKHLLNLAGDKIVCVYDESAWKWGIKFRDKEVVDAGVKMDINTLVVCEYSQLYEFAGRVRRLYQNQIKLHCPPRLHYINTSELDVFQQDALYRRIDLKSPEAPPSMMDEKKLRFLAELMRAGLRNPGDIMEMGVYQAGSVWYIANILQRLRETRKIYMIDVFEKHMMHPNATMCKDEIVRRLHFYPHCLLLEGLVDDAEILSQTGDGPLCFVHYDLGLHRGALEFVWKRLQAGSPLVLDNYGHLAIDPWDLDDFFSARGAHIIRNPWSEQGVVFKPSGSQC